jgi:hypothetical protein
MSSCWFAGTSTGYLPAIDHALRGGVLELVLVSVGLLGALVIVGVVVALVLEGMSILARRIAGPVGRLKERPSATRPRPSGR